MLDYSISMVDFVTWARENGGSGVRWGFKRCGQGVASDITPLPWLPGLVLRVQARPAHTTPHFPPTLLQRYGL